jgi:hypothetical protein
VFGATSTDATPDASKKETDKDNQSVAKPDFGGLGKKTFAEKTDMAA